jgi:hypothetical protein
MPANCYQCLFANSRPRMRDRMALFRGVQNTMFCPQPPGTGSWRPEKGHAIPRVPRFGDMKWYVHVCPPLPASLHRMGGGGQKLRR